ADNVGDNVGDVAGLGADILESYVASIVSAVVLAIFMKFADHGTMTEAQYYGLIILPVLIAGAGVLASLIGVLVVANMKTKDAQKSLSFGNLFTGALVLGFVAIVIGIAAPDYPFKDTFIINPEFVSRWRL
ncbi:MAG TPA: sodium-translocating pyrophosphatase, partial [Mesotoga infera]|nr:sodium-translocating pyrophosphatase [Mesotoga infera]